jgi:hypothetical protein
VETEALVEVAAAAGLSAVRQVLGETVLYFYTTNKLLRRKNDYSL